MRFMGSAIVLFMYSRCITIPDIPDVNVYVAVRHEGQYNQ